MPFNCLITATLLLLLCPLPLTLVSSAIPAYPTPYVDAADCSASFNDVDFSLNSTAGFHTVVLLPFLAFAALCPANCSSSSSSSSSSGIAVYGSFPYHGQSSVCLAAVHAGIIDDSVGGGVFVSRFYRHDWSNSSTQSIFPFTSAMGTLSNGVHSRDVDSSWYTVPSNASEWSYSVRGRGDYVVQRREAPFSPRVGHLQLTFKLWELTADYISYDWDALVIVGGRNATHYLNDVWVAWRRQDDVTADFEWKRMADAPFTPRSDVRLRADTDFQYALTCP